ACLAAPLSRRGALPGNWFRPDPSMHVGPRRRPRRAPGHGSLVLFRRTFFAQPTFVILMSPATQICDIVLPGYTLADRIGAGGYAEVWRAEAPGGIQKAVKLVHGYYEDEFAAQELKALERVKGVRHPFLLSLERFEIINGRLAILTELADMSLDQ